MEAHSLSSQYTLAANGSVSSNARQRPIMWYNGDFAAGCRRPESLPDVAGDFATGMSSAPRPMTVGSFATGMHTRTAADLGRGDFATGQRTERSDPPIDSDPRARRGLSRDRRDSLAA
jgi:hypothetical protein